MHVEHIDLIPHPMDAWRAALNALIACAPGDGPAIAAHLAEAREHALVIVDRTLATPGTAKLVDRLMLIGAGRLVEDRLTSRDVRPLSIVEAAVRLRHLAGLDPVRPRVVRGTPPPVRTRDQTPRPDHAIDQAPGTNSQPPACHQPGLLDGEPQ